MISNNASGSTILIVDDNPTNLKVLFSYLKQTGFRTLIATSGQAAIQQVNRLPPDLILLDVMMPGIDGFETCRRLKENDLSKDIPIIFITALNDTANKVKGFEAGGVDYITKPFQQEEVLARINAHLTIQIQKRDLYELNATKDKFFSIIAHDLKGALGGLLVFSDLLATAMEDYNPTQIAQIAQKMNDSLKNKFKLLENLLDWARLQKGNIEYKPEKLDLYTLAEANIELLCDTAQSKEITLINTIKPDTFFIFADPNMTQTIIRNLIANALKFTHPSGSVSIGADHQNDFVAIAIIDTGIGMEPEILKKLFKIESKIKMVGTANERGTGLGLLLCKEMAEKQGGQIWAESEVDKGSTFTFTVPISS
ncbi:MAG: hybrid sensor histidine kinase/response regulator [Anaerolineae bacterium]|nr:hybrid sensor histidine kinase/response regulator [Anaerolineae bacterium]